MKPYLRTENLRKGPYLISWQVARTEADGAAANGIVGGCNKGRRAYECEVYDETTNEWQSITSLKLKTLDTLLTANGSLYAVIWEVQRLAERSFQQLSVEFYYPEKNEWAMKSEMAFPMKWSWLTATKVGQ